MRSILGLSVVGVIAGAGSVAAQQAPPALNPRIHEIASAVSAERIAGDMTNPVGFGIRHFGVAAVAAAAAAADGSESTAVFPMPGQR